MRSAFSLVELSIVLVILGLLTGGILAGQSLLRAAEMRSVTAEYSKLTIASRTFRDKYFALAGDMSNATKFWGTATVCPGQTGNERTTAATCNGDGNGILQNAAAPNSNEVFGIWQHLANGGLIEGSYSGVESGSYGYYYGMGHNPRLNCPSSKLGNSVAWGAASDGAVPISDPNLIEGNYDNSLHLGMASPDTIPWHSTTLGAPLTSGESWNVDTKLDDGKAGTGFVVVPEYPANTNCYNLANGSPGINSTTTARADILYNLSNSSTACSLIFKSVL